MRFDEDYKQLYFKTRQQWRDWLSGHHRDSDGVWLVFYKKHTGESGLDYESAVREALCFGWIDSLIRKLDDQRYVRKMTPRRPNSRWSDLNKQRVEELTQSGQMAPAGLDAVRAARESGIWDEPAKSPLTLDMPEAFRRALEEYEDANAFFSQLASGYQKQYIGWVAAARREEPRERRIRESIALLQQGRKPGMK